MVVLRIGAYHFETEKGSTVPLFPELFNRIQALPENGKHLYIKGVPVRPRKLVVEGPYCLGDFSKIRMIDAMRLSSLTGEERIITFESEGEKASDVALDPTALKPSDPTALIIDPQCDVLYLHETENGISALSLARYFENMGQCSRLFAKPILKMDAMLRFQRQKRFTALRVGLAGIENARFLKDRGLSDSAIEHMISEYNTPVLSFEVRLEEKGKGTISHVVDTITALVGLPRKNLKQLKVLGSESDDQRDFPVDFIKDRIVVEFEASTPKGSMLKDEDRYRAVAQAWREFNEELRGRYPRAGPSELAPGI